MAPQDDEDYLKDDGGDEYAPRGRNEGGGREAPHRGTLILVFGILGIVFCPIFGIFAWVWGNEDLPKIRGGRMDPAGEGTTAAGRVLGIIASCLIILWTALIGLVTCGALVGGAASTSSY